MDWSLEETRCLLTNTLNREIELTSGLEEQHYDLYNYVYLINVYELRLNKTYDTEILFFNGHFYLDRDKKVLLY